MNPPSNAYPALILASASPRRREILGRLGVSFDVTPAHVEEVGEERMDPERMVLHNARIKSEEVASRFPEAIVIGADTAVFLDGIVFNKPSCMEEAYFMLGRLSGRTHAVFTGLRLFRKSEGREWAGTVRSEVTFKPMTYIEVREYFKRVDPLDKAGAYGIQEESERIISRFSGSLTNVIGLPIDETRAALLEMGYETPK